MGELKAKEYKRFEDIKHIRDDGSEYWYARELSAELDYVQWRNFSSVLDKAKLACKNSGFDIDDHFAEVSKMVEIGSGTMPESLPVPEKSISQVEREQIAALKRKAKKKPLMLDE